MWAVVLAESEIPAEMREPVAQALADVVGMVPLDAQGVVRRAQGVLLDNTIEFTARRVAEKINALGLTVGVAERPEVGRRWPTRSATPTKTGLYASAGDHDRERFDWSSVHALSLVRHQEQKTVGRNAGHLRPGGALPIGFRVAGASVQTMTQARADMFSRGASIAGHESYVLDIFLLDPQLTLRINARQFDYSYLADRMAPRFEVNFHILVSHLLQGAPHAVRSPLLDRFARGDLLEAEMVTDLKEFDLYNRWLLLAAAAFSDPSG